MEWRYAFSDHPGSVAGCIKSWNKILSVPPQCKYTITFDMTELQRFGMTGLLQLSGFIALHRKKIKAQTEKVRIVLKSEEQEKLLKSGLRITPYLTEFEIVREI